MNVKSQVDYEFLYNQGEIASWYLRKSQQTLYKLLWTGTDIVTSCHRRFGKDTVVLTYAAEKAALNKNYLIRYGAPTIKQAYEISDFILTKIYHKDIKQRPAYKDKGGYWEWANGAKMYLFGGKDRVEVEKGRGVEADLVILSEFGFFKYKPDYLLSDVLGPQLDTTNGQIIIVSTIPDDITHIYVQKLREASSEGRAFEWDIMQSFRAGSRSLKQMKKIIKRCGGVKTDTFQREYLCKLVPSKGRLIIPEAQNEKTWVGSQEKPDYYDCYEVADLGFRDHTAVLFGYHDFHKARLIIESELWFNYTSTKEIVGKWKPKSEGLGYDNPRRLADNELQQLADMNRDYGFYVSAIVKRKKSQSKGNFLDSIINQLRVAIGQGKILVDKDRCPNLYSQLRFGIWNERRTDFERTDTMGHWDAGIALCYMLDNINWGHNPYPVVRPDVDRFNTFIEPELLKDNTAKSKIAGIFGKRR